MSANENPSGRNKIKRRGRDQSGSWKRTNYKARDGELFGFITEERTYENGKAMSFRTDSLLRVAACASSTRLAEKA